MTDKIKDSERVIARSITNQEGIVGKQEGNNRQDVHGRVEKPVMARDSSNLDQNKLRRTWVENGKINFSIGGVDVSEEEYFKK
jgi:hypothetical protein